MCNILDSHDFHFSLWICDTLCGNILDQWMIATLATKKYPENETLVGVGFVGPECDFVHKLHEILWFVIILGLG
jgi:hypothetical protein